MGDCYRKGIMLLLILQASKYMVLTIELHIILTIQHFILQNVDTLFSFVMSFFADI